MAKPQLSTQEKARRLHCALEATYEIDSIARHLAKNLPSDTEQIFYRGLLLRVIELNSLAISVLGDDDSRATSEMNKILTGDIA